MFAAQLESPLIWMLIGAAGISWWLEDATDAIAIGAIVVLVVVIGFVQEYRAERALEALREIAAPKARVVRDGEIREVPADRVVVGDLVLLEAGDVVPADAELLDANLLRTDEAALTGESLPVDKQPGALPADTPLAERADQVFLGTAVARGTARARVIATGMRTEMGRIAGMLAETQREPTVLQRHLARVGRALLLVCLAMVAAVGALGLWRGGALADVGLIAISLAVAAVPEGLPAMVTVALALGVRRMARRNVLVRRLSAVETLGSATVICTDKTGTLTEGRMAVREVWGDRARVLRAMVAASDADLDRGTGDTTELALLEAAAEAGIDQDELEASAPRVDSEPFDSATRRMWVRREGGVIFLKGALDAVLAACANVDAEARQAESELAARGLRVLAAAEGPDLGELRLVGLVGLADPPRAEARAALEDARHAGIRTIMLTGDHEATARAVARELGLLDGVDDPSDVVRARVTAADKLALVRELRAQGEIVAMTGDGVNDAPALREADIGVAMGRSGTQVTRGASDMVLLDDDYASIVAAVREGRGIWDDIRNALTYVLGGNAGELLVMLGAVAIGWPMPLIPLQILWINLVSDGLPALALVMEPAGGDVLERKPRRPDAPMLGRAEWMRIAGIGLLDAAVVLAVYAWALGNVDVDRARTLAFTALVSCELLRAFAARSWTRTLFELGLRGNPVLIATVVGTIGMQLVLIAWEPLRSLFHLAVPSTRDLAVAFAVGLIPVTVLELWKLVWRRR